MEHRQVGVHALGPADEDAPKAVHPTVGSFHDPTPSPEACFLLDGLGLFTPGPDVSGKAKGFDQRPDLVEIVAFVQANTLRAFSGTANAFFFSASPRLRVLVFLLFTW